MSAKDFDKLREEHWGTYYYGSVGPLTLRNAFDYAFTSGYLSRVGTEIVASQDRENINGIIVSGNVYTLTDRRGWNCSPFDCDLYAHCHKDEASYRDRPCQLYDEDTGFRFNKELTNKLKQHE